jgi:hypothetical protein
MIKLKHTPKLEFNIWLYFLIIMGLIVIFSLLSSCKTLQSTKGYEKYPKNYDWKTDVL